ncbi:MAG: hypothetical protein NXI20_00355 [bacterium]|nr:hypothetical protein [bacterium]
MRILLVISALILGVWDTSNTNQNGSGNSIYIGLVDKFYDQDEFHVPLFFKEGYDYAIIDKLKDSDSKVIFRGEFSRRTKLYESQCKLYLESKNLDTMLVLNKLQQVVDTVFRNHFEHYDAEIQSSLIASYKIDPGKKPFMLISKSGLNRSDLKPGISFTVDTTYRNNVLESNNQFSSYSWASGKMSVNDNIISYTSFGDYNARKECLYFYKNGIPTDSVINDYLIRELYPVPIQDSDHMLYMASGFLPETDITWDMLIGINPATGKIKYYRGNRLKQ